MNYFEIKLRLECVEKFVGIMSRTYGEFTLRNKDCHITVDPKSLLGVMALDLSRELILEYYNLETIGEILDFRETILEFLV